MNPYINKVHESVERSQERHAMKLNPDFFESLIYYTHTHKHVGNMNHPDTEHPNTISEANDLLLTVWSQEISHVLPYGIALVDPSGDPAIRFEKIPTPDSPHLTYVDVTVHPHGYEVTKGHPQAAAEQITNFNGHRCTSQTNYGDAYTPTHQYFTHNPRGALLTALGYLMTPDR